MMTIWRLPCVILPVVLLVGGCGDDDPCLCPAPEPPLCEFHVLSEYVGPPVSPRYHYEYSISVDIASNDEITFYPTYRGDETPVWTEGFDAPQDDLRALYALMLANDIFRDSWEPEQEHPVGGPEQCLQGTVLGVDFYVPKWIEDRAAVSPVYSAIDSLVPEAVWDSLWARRGRFFADHAEP